MRPRLPRRQLDGYLAAIKAHDLAKAPLLTVFFDIKAGKVPGIYAVIRYVDADAPDGTGWS